MKKGRKHASWLGIYESSLATANKRGNQSMAVEMEKKKQKQTQMEERAFCEYQQDCWMMEEWEQEEGGIPDVMGFLAESQTDSRESG